MSDVGHNCGVFISHSLHDIYDFANSGQHRGREATGIGAIGKRNGKKTIDAIVWAGPVKAFDLGDLHKIFQGDYHTFFSHVRYATKGRKNIKQLLQDAHPITMGGEVIDRKDHILLRDCRLAAIHNGQVDDSFFEGYDFGELKTETDTEKLLRFYNEVGEKEVMRKVPGAYTMAIADKNKAGIMVMRDKKGIKPGSLGEKDGKIVMASEDSILLKNGATIIQELEPGTIYYIPPDGKTFKTVPIEESDHSHCFFEWNYIARAESTMNRVQVRALREALGEKLAEEYPLKDFDFITYLPRCPEPAARSYAKKLGKEVTPIFYKKNSERSFLGSESKDRKKSIKGNLHLLPNLEDRLKGKKVLVIDDSIVRGNNSDWARYLLTRVAKVKESMILSYTPQIGILDKDGKLTGCEYGVDMPPGDDFLAKGRTLEEMGKKIGMPVNFLSLDGMLEVFEGFGLPKKELCYRCVGGPKPF